MLDLVWNKRYAFQQIDGTQALHYSELKCFSKYLPKYRHSESKFALCDPIRDFEKVFVNPIFGKYNPQKLAPSHSESLSQLKTLTCKWRLNCAVEPDSLQTDARHHGTFKGQGKKTPNSKKGTKPTPFCSKQTTIIWQRQRKPRKATLYI